ncbi:hypothetical protein ACFWUZ_32695 [Streptomyces sp. NPDC058646]|uniref:hypothetical protein n=1 Tax=Streptomyces sp. NPDC058646 TaxID=3346574 RepID=UPI003667CF3B
MLPLGVAAAPMACLTEWRVALAADLLRESGAPLDVVARRVGPGRGFAVSPVFQRAYGVSPQEHRSAGPRCVAAARSRA